MVLNLFKNTFTVESVVHFLFSDLKHKTAHENNDYNQLHCLKRVLEFSNRKRFHSLPEQLENVDYSISIIQPHQTWVPRACRILCQVEDIFKLLCSVSFDSLTLHTHSTSV